MKTKKPIVTYKGFNQDFKCRDHQYKEGEEYTTDKPVKRCSHGFHSCENPFDVWTYYDIIDSRFAQCEASGDSSTLELNGTDSIGAGIGMNCKIKASKGNWIVLAEWVYDNKKGRNVPKCVKTAKIDGKKLKADTFYKLQNGKFVKA